jgi:hypothetical protein
MSVQNDTSRVSYVGNNSTSTEYPVGFYFFADADLVVTVTDVDGVDSILVLDTDYSVTGAGDADGGAVVTDGGAIPATSTVTIARTLAATQLTEYQDAGKFPASSHELALDKLTMLVQELKRSADGSFRLRESDGDIDPLASVVTSVLGLNGSGAPVLRTADEMLSFLAITGVTATVERGIQTFEDATERGTAVPDFTGQLGTQRDTGAIYLSTGTSAGNWASFTALLAAFAANTFTADAAGRLPFADGFLNAAKLASDAVETAKILDANVTAGKLAATLDISGKTLTMPTGHWSSIAPVGAVLQTIYAQTATRTTLTTPYIPNDNTVPTSSEGTLILSGTITPIFSNSKILATFASTASTGSGDMITTALFRGSAAAAIASSMVRISGGSNMGRTNLTFLDSPATGSAETYNVRMGTDAATAYVNGSADFYGGTLYTTLTLQEIKV